MLVQKGDYFKDLANMFDMARIAAIYFFIMAKQFGGEAPDWIVPVMFFLLWIKIFKYLSVFAPFRYFVMMLLAMIADIRVFLAILFIAMFAYGQIMLTMSDKSVADDEAGAIGDFRQGYVLAFGDLGAFADYGWLKFFMFSMFTFLIPLTLMNMLIAIMSDTYGRVQENSAAADARALAEWLHELEEITRIFTFKFKGSMVGSAYKFSFYTKAVTEEDLEALALKAEGEEQSKG